MNNYLHITRTFNAPKKLVFEACTQKEHLAHWWGPAGYGLEIMNFELKPGGMFHYKMIPPSGDISYGAFHFREITPFDILIFTTSFTDAQGNKTRAPFLAEFPLEILNTWTFSEKDGKTTIEIKGVALAENEQESAVFMSIIENVTEGTNKTFDQLQDYMSKKFELQKEVKSKEARVSTYLNFPGNTEEAFEFYKSIFKTEYIGKGIQRLGDVPSQPGQPELDEATKKMILFIALPTIGNHILMATDAPESMGFKVNAGNNIHIHLDTESKEQADYLFNALSVDGIVEYPIQDMFWGAYYGNFQDKFGINWMINYTA